MIKKLPIAIAAVCLTLPTLAHAQKTEFWVGNGAVGVNSFLAHKDKIDVISPTWYHFDEDGLVSGEPQAAVLNAAKDAHVSIIPLFALFNHDKLHLLIGNPKAQDALIASLLRECHDNAYDGVNLDIEDVLWTDRDGLSALVKKVADALHQQHLQVQIDVVPNAPGHPGDSPYSTWIYAQWRGAYDLKALAQSVDLICLMTYDQSTRWTTPGPVDGWVWTKQNLDYALQFVPKSKLSLGIALYGYHWYTGAPNFDGKKYTPNPSADYISEPNAIFLRDTYNGKTQWDDAEHTPWFFIDHDQMREWVFYSDQRAFMDRFNLAKQTGLEGVCAWDLGDEDPAIWPAIPANR
ncbi:MAG: glycosyl hydrolase family 18 protein [Acidobacteriaceae bacterium]